MRKYCDFASELIFFFFNREEFRAFVMGNPFVKATYEVKVANNAEVTTKAGCTCIEPLSVW